MNQNNIVSSISLEEVFRTPIGNLANLAPEKLLILQSEAYGQLQKAKLLKEWLDQAITLKYHDLAANLRQTNAKDSGTIHFSDGNCQIMAVLNKKVEWDQIKLKEVINKIKETGDNPAEYVEVSYRVLESKYSSWPESIKNIFKPARIFKTANEIFKIQPQISGQVLGGSDE